MTDQTETPPIVQPDLSLTRDFEILNRYQGFSSEILRLAVLAITGLGLLFTAISPKDSVLADLRASLGQGPINSALSAALIFFGLAAAAALGHRYLSSDSMACHIHLQRLRATGKGATRDAEAERDERNRNLRRSRLALLWASIALGLGAAALAIAFLCMLRAMAPPCP